MNVSKNNKGFSLIELMVVVAIIGILATIAVPNFQKFQARSKQTNAKAELSSIYSAQKSFFAEYSTYSAVLPVVGFVPEGTTETAAGYSARSGVKRYYGVSSGPTAGADVGNLTGTLLLAQPNAFYMHGYPASGNLCSLMMDPVSTTKNAGITATLSISADMFTALSTGCPLDRGQTASTMDVWYINNQRVLTNAQSGL
jgi:type IV pilus assembly protein PilA